MKALIFLIGVVVGAIAMYVAMEGGYLNTGELCDQAGCPKTGQIEYTDGTKYCEACSRDIEAYRRTGEVLRNLLEE